MDKVELFLVKQQAWLSWTCWKMQFIPYFKRFWKERYDFHRAEIAELTELSSGGKE